MLDKLADAYRPSVGPVERVKGTFKGSFDMYAMIR